MKGGKILAEEAKNWPTPTKRDYKDTGNLKNVEENCLLGRAVIKRKWATPRQFMHKDSTKDRGKGNLGEQIQGQLNPDWTEWLMGWPIGWTSLEPITELLWFDWSIDPADMEEPQEWRTPAQQEPGVNHERLEPIKGGSLGGMNRHFDKETGRMAQTGITQQVQLREQGQGVILRVAIKIKDRINRLKAIGNGQVPLCMATAWEILTNHER